MAKKRPTQEYLEELQIKEETVWGLLQQSQQDLYKLTATAKLGEPEFEAARLSVLSTAKLHGEVLSEITRVKKALTKLPELPFEE